LQVSSSHGRPWLDDTWKLWWRLGIPWDPISRHPHMDLQIIRLGEFNHIEKLARLEPLVNGRMDEFQKKMEDIFRSPPKHGTSGGLQVCEATNRRISQIGEAEIVLTFDSAMLGVGKTVAMMISSLPGSSISKAPNAAERPCKRVMMWAPRMPRNHGRLICRFQRFHIPSGFFFWSLEVDIYPKLDFFLRSCPESVRLEKV